MSSFLAWYKKTIPYIFIQINSLSFFLVSIITNLQSRNLFYKLLHASTAYDTCARQHASLDSCNVTQAPGTNPPQVDPLIFSQSCLHLLVLQSIYHLLDDAGLVPIQSWNAQLKWLVQQLDRSTYLWCIHDGAWPSFLHLVLAPLWSGYQRVSPILMIIENQYGK